PPVAVLFCLCFGGGGLLPRGSPRRWLAGLRDELGETERFDDVGRPERARMEKEAIVEQLAAAVGLGACVAGVDAERARSTVTHGIESASPPTAGCGQPAGRGDLGILRAAELACPEPESPRRGCRPTRATSTEGTGGITRRA